MLRVISNDEIDRQENAERAALQASPEVILSSLEQYIMDQWESAKRAKNDIETEMLKDAMQMDGEYEPEKLAAIKEVGAPEVFSQITDTKARTAYAWIDENIIQQGRRIWSIEPTPVPDLPDHIKEKINQDIIQRSMAAFQQIQMQLGVQVPQEEMKSLMNRIFEQVGKRVEDELKVQSREMADKMADKIHDQLTEGGFYDALPDLIKDLLRCKAAFIKGPIFRKEKIKKINLDPQTGRLFKSIEERIIPTYERRSAFNIYPAAGSTGIDDGALMDVIYLSRKQLYDLIGLPGFNETIIREVIHDYDNGTLDNWLFINSDVRDAVGFDEDPTSGAVAGKIQCLEFWDFVDGKKLIDYGMSAEEIPDPDDSYPICAWVINKKVIKAMLNYDAFGKKPYSKTSFEKVPDSFWGKSLAEVIRDPQQICNAAARNMVYNMAVASGPQVEVNMDRVNDNNKSLIPWKVWEVTNEQMESGPAIRFYQPKPITSDLLAIYTAFSKIADEHSGIPAYSHGSATIGGAGNTASGFQMLLNQSARGIKQLIKSIDIDIIEPVLERQYEYNIENEELYGLVGDFRIVAQGYSIFASKEANVMRKVELLPLLNNPVDLQIMGLDGRKQLLYDAFDSLDIDSHKIIPPDTDILPSPPQAAQNQAPPPGLEQLDAAGNRVVGQDTRQFTPENQPGQVSTPGNPGDGGRR